MPAVGYPWVQELSSILSRPVGCPADWAKSKAPEPAAPKEKATSGVKVFSSSGDWANSADAIAAKGFNADQRLRLDDKIFTLKSITETDVDLSCHTPQMRTFEVSHAVFLNSKYVLAKGKFETISDMLEHDPQQNVDWLTNV